MIKRMILSLCILLMHINLAWANLRIATIYPFKEIDSEKGNKKYPSSISQRIPQFLEERLAKKAPSKQIIFLERKQYNDVLEEFEFENKRRADFDNSSTVQRLRSLGANCVLVGNLDQNVSSEEIIIDVRIVSLETAQKLAHHSQAVTYSILNSSYMNLLREINKIADEINIQMTEYYTDEAIKMKIQEYLINQVANLSQIRWKIFLMN